MVKRIGIGIIVFGLMLVMGIPAQAVPELGVGGELQTCGADYWTCFAGNSASGSGESFALPASGGNITLWSNITGADIWLVAESSLGTITFDGGANSSQITVNGQIDGYSGLPYQGINLGPVTVGPWAPFPAGTPFDTGQNQFYYYTGAITYTGLDVTGDWLFLVADINGSGLPLDDSGQGHDVFSPKTTSMVPEPGTAMLLGSGLLGLVLYRRKFKA
jgi:hypothetical protein